MIDQSGVTTFLWLVAGILIPVIILTLAFWTLKPQVKLWDLGKADFPVVGTLFWGFVLAVSLIAYGYGMTYKETHKPDGPTPAERRAIEKERESREVEFSPSTEQSLEEKSEGLLGKSRQEHDDAVNRFRNLPK